VTLVLGRAREVAPHDLHKRTAAWSVATTAFALGQASAAYWFSFLLNHTGSYLLLFEIGAATLVLAFTTDLVVAALDPRSSGPPADKAWEVVHASRDRPDAALTRPIIQAPLAGGGHAPDLVAAVCKMGALDLIGAAYLTPPQIIEASRTVRAQTARPLGTNLIAPLQNALTRPLRPRCARRQ
jgi:hypothetical protein